MSHHSIIRPIIGFSVLPITMLIVLSCSDADAPADPGQVTDIDGNIYHTVAIGNQVWMVENLKVTKYSNGDAIPNLTDPSDWNNTVTTGTWGYYNNDPSVNTDYGKHYNWYAVMDSRKLCPKGWHVPSADEWEALVDHLGGEEIAGGKMKEEGLGHWLTPNADATNESGFGGLPGGTIGYNAFLDLGTYGRWWSSTQYSTGYTAHFTWLSYDNAEFNLSDTNKENGFCVRCMKD